MLTTPADHDTPRLDPFERISDRYLVYPRVSKLNGRGINSCLFRDALQKGLHARGKKLNVTPLQFNR